MYSSKAYTLKKQNAGFTIVELLIVIVVIAILAAIVIVSYNGVREKAVETSLKSDLQTASTILENDRTMTGAFPASANLAQNGKGIPSSQDNSLAYTTKPYGYCVTATNPALPNGFVLKSSTNQIQQGTCEASATTFAGADGSGTAYVDGDVADARFACAYGLAVARNGDLYVGTDSNLAHIRKITQSGTASTVATLWDTRPYCPRTHVVDSQGNVYFTVSTSGYAHQIWRMTPQGGTSVFAGGATSGYVNAQGTAARLSYPSGLVIDDSDTIYFADRGNNRIRKIDPAGNVSFFSGSGVNGTQNGSATTAQYANLSILALGKDGVLYVGDSPRIRKVMPDGSALSLAGSGSWGYVDGAPENAQFQDISSLVVDRNNVVYSADYDGAYIRKIMPDGTVSTVLGDPYYGSVDGVGDEVRFRSIRGMQLDSSGILWITDGSTIRRVEL